MEKDELADYIERSQSLIDSSPQMDEQNTRRKLIEPLLEILGWNMLSEDVELEYSVQMGVGTKKVDYALMIEGAPVVFVEAKGVDTAISDSHQNQLKSYMRQVGVDWGLLTNGVQFELLKRKKGKERPDEVSLGEISLDSLQDNAHLLHTLSRESIKTGEAERIAENIETTQRAATDLREKKDIIANRITQVVTDEVGDSVSQTVQDGAKQFVDVLATSLKQQSENGVQFEWNGGQEFQKESSTEWVPGEGKNAIVGSIPRSEISGSGDSQTAIFPTRKSGIRFLKENNAWGFVRVGQDPEYAAFYVAGGPQEIRYIASIKEIVPAKEATLAREAESYTGDEAGFDPGDEVVVFQPGTLYELEDPIPYKRKAPQGRVYSDLASFRNATTTEDVI
jgi:hypothetical protein